MIEAARQARGTHLAMTQEIHGRFQRGAEASAQGVYAAPTGAGEASAAGVDGYAAVFCGHPYWSDASLAARSRELGMECVLIERFRAEGSGFLERLAGDFAIAVGATEPGGDGLIAIDRMGIGALYYTVTPQGLHFGTRVGQVLASAGLPGAVDAQAVFNYIYFHVIPSPRSIYREVRKLEPGQYACVVRGETRIDSYWTPSFVMADARVDRRALLEETRQCIEAAVRRRAGDAATGAFLSGGLDSSTVSGMLARVCAQPVSTFSIGFDESGYDELPYARIAARHFGTRAFEHYVDIDDIERAVPRLAAHFDEPFGNSSAIPAYICARLAEQQGMKVLLAGDGGDELFAGNARYARQMLFEWYGHVPGRLRRDIIEGWLVRGDTPPALWPLRKLHRYVAQASTPLPDRMEAHNLLQLMPTADVFTPAFMAQVDPGEPLQALRRRYQATEADSALDRMLFLDWKLTLADNDLRKVGAACELAGIAVRYPMLDDAVVALSARVPAQLKLRRLKLRAFYKEAFGDFLPAAIVNKSKHGFGLPFGQWLRKSARLNEMVDDSLTRLKSREILNPVFIDRVRESHRSEHAAFYGTMVWVLFMLEQWWQQRGPDSAHQADAVAARGAK